MKFCILLLFFNTLIYLHCKLSVFLYLLGKGNDSMTTIYRPTTPSNSGNIINDTIHQSNNIIIDIQRHSTQDQGAVA